MELKDLRVKIDAVDDEIAKLYVKRMELVRDVAATKARDGLPVVNTEREKQIVNRVTATMPDDIKLYGKQVYQALFATGKAYQYAALDLDSPIKNALDATLAGERESFPIQATVACQGVSGAYSCIAAEKLFPISSISCFKTWDAVFSAVEAGFCQFGVLPIENSTAGSVDGVYDLMRKHKFYIVRSVKLRVKHYLLAKKHVDISQIKEIVSHEQALTQCSELLKSLGDIKVTRCDNTATAAKLVAESDRDDIACISSKECAGVYGLTVLKAGVNDSDSNYTRFIAISKNLKVYDKADHISVTVDLAHEAGSLNRVLDMFSTLGLNLTKLESRPKPDSPFEFSFYFDFEADIASKEVRNLLAYIAESSDNFEFLGAYEEL